MQTQRKLLFPVFTGLLLISGCTSSTSIPAASNDKPPSISLLSSSVRPSLGAIYPTIAQGEGQAALKELFVFPANGIYKFVGHAYNHGGVKTLSITVTQAGTVLYSAHATGTQNGNGSVPTSLSLFGSGNRPFEFNIVSGTVTVTADATNFNDMPSHFVVTYAVPPDPVVTLTSTDVCNGGNSPVLNITLKDSVPETSFTASWYREELFIGSPPPLHPLNPSA